MKIFRVFIVCVIFSAMLLLPGCGDDRPVIYVFNWGDYIGENVLRDFTNETGIRVRYETFDSNEAMYAKVRNNPGVYDVLVPSEYMAERMINEGMLERINLDNIPNARYIDDRFRGFPIDPYDNYFLSYMWGTVGILYNTTMVYDVVDSWDVLWDERYAGLIFMYDSSRDSIGAALKRLGYSLNTRNIDELNRAVDSLREQMPLVRAYLTDPIKDAMIAGEGALAIVYSGDALFCQMHNPDLNFVIPREGSNVWVDGFVIPIGARNQEGAEAFINFMLRPDIAARNTEYIGYTTTNWAALELIDEDMRNNPIFWPTDEELERLEMFYDLGDFRSTFEGAWLELFIGN